MDSDAAGSWTNPTLPFGATDVFLPMWLGLSGSKCISLQVSKSKAKFTYMLTFIALFIQVPCWSTGYDGNDSAMFVVFDREMIKLTKKDVSAMATKMPWRASWQRIRFPNSFHSIKFHPQPVTSPSLQSAMIASLALMRRWSNISFATVSLLANLK